MAIKFSQFVVKTSSSDLSHIVGYNGVDNIQITPNNFLNSALTGTPGQVLFYDTTGVAGDNDLYWDNTNKRLGIGTTSPSQKLDVAGSINLDGTSTRVFFGGNNTFVGENSNSNELILRGGGSGTSESVYIDTSGNVGIGTSNPGEKLVVIGNIKVGDSQKFLAGNSQDLQIYHDATDSRIENSTGHLRIVNFADDSDIRFSGDDGSGGTTEYFRVDGGAEVTLFSKILRLQDNVRLDVGNSTDGRFFHDGTDTILTTITGNLIIKNDNNDGDIIFKCDDGSGGIAEYFRVDGGAEQVIFSKDIKTLDNVNIRIGSGGDLRLYHNGSNNFIEAYSGNLTIQNHTDDADIIFKSDDGSGGVTSYFSIDGSAELNRFQKNVMWNDSVVAYFGGGFDLSIFHDGTDSRIYNNTGDFVIRNQQDDGDIKFQSDDGSGGVTTYFQLDGGVGATIFPDNSKLQLGGGASGDMRLFHDGSLSQIVNNTGNLQIVQFVDDGDIIFKSDDGSGGTTEYFRVDGSSENVLFSKIIKLSDNVELRIGDGNDLKLFSDGSNGYVSGEQGDLYIRNRADDRDIFFQCDDGSGGATTYFKLDGSSTDIQYFKDLLIADNVKVNFGNSNDLQIQHDGSNSFIQDVGTGNLFIEAVTSIMFRKYNTAEFMAKFINDGAVELYHDNVKKLDTRTTGVRITGVSEYADNAAAIAGGLTTGDVYRTGDLLKIVH